MRRAVPVAFLLLAACGPAVRPEVVTTPFTAEHEPLFENGIDLVEDPQALGGTWFETWQAEMESRIGLSDGIALVTIRTLRTDTDLERRDTFRLVAHRDRIVDNEAALPEAELLLSVSEGDPGYASVESSERRLLDQQFFVFVKWQRTDAGTVARWHLAPATDDVARQVNGLLSRRRRLAGEETTDRRVIVHRN